MVKSDRWIREMAAHGMIEPFMAEKVKTGVSFGPSSYGYDFRLHEEFRIFRGECVIGPKKMDESLFESFSGTVCVIPPHTFVLGRSVEYFRIPREVIGICFSKSTYARCGVVVTVTPLEPEWEGFITIHIANLTPAPVEVYAGEGIGQVLFVAGAEVCERSYRDAGGKYQSASCIQMAR